MSTPEDRNGAVDLDTVDPALAADFQRLLEVDDAAGEFKRRIVLKDPEFGTAEVTTAHIGDAFPLNETQEDFLVVLRNGRLLVLNSRNIDPARRGPFHRAFTPNSDPQTYASDQYNIHSLPELFRYNKWIAADSKEPADRETIKSSVRTAVSLVHRTLNGQSIRLPEERTPFFYDGHRPDFLGPERPETLPARQSGTLRPGVVTRLRNWHPRRR